jgi:hypothetical protein
MIQAPGPNLIKLFTAVILECSQSARVFVTGKPLQLSLVFKAQTLAYYGNHKLRP